MARKTKKQKEAEELEANEQRIRDAFRWSERVEPTIPIPQTYNELSVGWLYIDSIEYPRVTEACSSSIAHSRGRTDRTTTQHGVRLYATRLEALHALRGALVYKMAEILAKVDRQISKEENKNSDEAEDIE